MTSERCDVTGEGRDAEHSEKYANTATGTCDRAPQVNGELERQQAIDKQG